MEEHRHLEAPFVSRKMLSGEPGSLWPDGLFRTNALPLDSGGKKKKRGGGPAAEEGLFPKVQADLLFTAPALRAALCHASQ